MSAPEANAASASGARFDVRKMSWKRVAVLVAAAAIIAAALTYVSDNMLVLNADGLVLRERQAAAAPYEARIKQIFVRSGDYVRAGDRIAILESASMSRALAELSAQRARLTSSIAQLEARRVATDALFPIAKTNASRIHALLDELERVRDRGMASFSHLQQVTTAAYAADERLASLQAERKSADEELRQNRLALAELETAYQDLKSVYADGVLVAGASGYVGSSVADSGEVLVPGGKVLEIYTGRPFVVAYVPDSSFVNVEEGELVRVSGAGKRTLALVEKMLPMAEALPPEFQKPVRARESGQLLRLALIDEHDFVTRQKVRVTGCYVSSCTDIGSAGVTAAKTIGTYLAGWLTQQYGDIARRVEHQVDAIKDAAETLPHWIGKASARPRVNSKPGEQLAGKRS